MDASTRIAKIFDRLLKIKRDKILKCKLAEQIIYFVIIARCEKDMGGFSGIFEQALNLAELKILISGLQRIDEQDLAAEFEECLEILHTADFYPQMNWQQLASSVQKKIDGIGKRVGDQLWDLDEKLVELIESNPI